MSTVETIKPPTSSTVLRGQIYWCDLFLVAGCEQGNIRPVLVLSNDRNNLNSPNCTVLIITSSLVKAKLPVHVDIKANEFGIDKDSIICAEQIKTLDQFRLMDYIGTLSESKMKEVARATRIQLGL